MNLSNTTRAYLNIFMALSVSLIASPHAALAGPHGGGGGAPHLSAPAAHAAAPVPHFSAPAPHMSAPAFHPASAAFHPPAPHFAAPAHVAAPHVQAPHMAAVPRFASPAHMAAPHMQAPHMVAATHSSALAAHANVPHAEAPRQLAMTHMVAPHAQNPHENAAHMGGVNPKIHEQMHQQNSLRPNEGEAKYAHMEPTQRDAFMSKMNAPERATAMSHMNNEQRAEAMYKMSPEQRAQTLTRMNPEERKSFMSPREAGMRGAAGVGALAAAGGAVGMMHRDLHGEAGHLQEHVGINREGARINGARTVGAAPSFANPRRAFGGEGFQKKGEPLRYREDVKDYPHAGSAREGRAGALDPGGYIRNSTAGERPITPAFARSQFAAAHPNFGAFAAANYRNRITNRGAWPWQLPAYAPGWFNGGGGNCYWWQDGGGGWGYGPNCFNGWGGSLPWWANIADLIPWGVNSDMNWVPYQDYYNGYTYGGQTYNDQYFAPNGYCPTDYIFNVATGQFLVPGHGYVDGLPPGFTAPITVSVPESVPNYNFQGQIVGYQVQTFYYNAYWNAQNEAYGYYDYRQQFHWLTFPWLNSWSGPQ